MSDDDLIEPRYTISSLQDALERADARLRQLEMEVGTLKERVAVGDENLDNLRLDLRMGRLRGTIADAAADAQAQADITKLRLLPSDGSVLRSLGSSSRRRSLRF